MSSIYRKGRDGYYYYQTYVHNSETGKKDKRIFHSLGTKDKVEAEEKQVDLDTQYEKKIQSQRSRLGISFITQNKKMLATILGTVIITLIVMDQFESKPKENKIKIGPPITKDVIIEKSTLVPEVNLSADKGNEKIDIIEKEKANPDINKPTIKPEKPKPAVPKYTVIRVDRLSGAFEQGKIFLTVNQSAGTESLRLLCEKITKQYTEFSNIVICLYTNNDTGREMANGNAPNVSKEEQKAAWLAMYTYNPVEGAYFDDNPGGYLGAY